MAAITIDGKDIYTTYGAVPCRGFYEALLTPPESKGIVVNESRLEHGTRVVKNCPMYKKQREVTLEFFIKALSVADYLSKYQSFVDAVSQKAITMVVPKINMTFRLVYSRCAKYGDYGNKSGKFAITFIEYNPDDRKAYERT